MATTMRAELPAVAEQVLAAIVAEVPTYADPFSGRMGRNIETAVATALGGFLDLASRPGGAGSSRRNDAVLEAAYALGRGEARAGRSMDALASAYRVGARVAWRDLSASAVEAGLTAQALAGFAELVFAYIDELSAASVTGHADELATTGRVRQRHLDRLAQLLLTGGSDAQVDAAAQGADWRPPRTLTAVLLPEPRSRGLRAALDGRTLGVGEDLPGLDPSSDLMLLMVPDADGSGRPGLLRSLRDRDAVVGPARPWRAVRSSYRRAVRTLELGAPAEGATVDTEDRLADLVLSADPEALADLRDQVLAPLDGLRPGTSAKLTETLRSWLLHHGRREDVAADLFVHAQTVRYRMGQLRELYGDRLDDPATTLALTLALGTWSATDPPVHGA